MKNKKVSLKNILEVKNDDICRFIFYNFFVMEYWY